MAEQNPYIQPRTGRKLAIIDKSNFKSQEAFTAMYEDFETKKWLQQIQKIALKSRTMNEVTYEKNRCLAILRANSRKPKWRKLLAIDLILGGMGSGNLPPLILKQCIAPKFFRDFPSGCMCYLPVSELRSIELLKIVNKLGTKYQPDFQGYVFPHPVSNLDLEFAFREAGLDIALHFTYPYLMGINAPLTFGNVSFLTGTPILSFDRSSFSAQEALSLGISNVYTDSYTPSRGVKRPILVDDSGGAVFSACEYLSYFEWYISTIQNLYDLVLGITDEENAFLASISISRIMFEIYLTILSDIPLVRLMLAFAVLDKFADLSCELGYSQKSESQTWTDMLSNEFFLKSSELLKQIPGLGQRFSRWNTNIQEELQRIPDEEELKRLRPDMTACKLMRIYRNSYHGYLLRDDLDRKAVLSHSGEIFNEFADVTFFFWNSFLQNPSRFLSV